MINDIIPPKNIEELEKDQIIEEPKNNFTTIGYL
jgi:hypothetical protein